MAKLTTKGRKALPSKDFGLPGTRSYPMENRSHAANAKARAAEEFHSGNLSASQKARIDAKADKILARGK
jgi:hypothetical protein